MTILTGTCIAIDGKAVLLRGASGAGKSDLALRLIAEGARLVADDGVEVRVADGGLMAAAPPAIAGRMEVRGLGVVDLGGWVEAPLVVVVDLVAPAAVERMPEPAFADVIGFAVPLYRLAPFEASASAKVRLAVRLACGDIKACE